MWLERERERELELLRAMASSGLLLDDPANTTNFNYVNYALRPDGKSAYLLRDDLTAQRRMVTVLNWWSSLHLGATSP